MVASKGPGGLFDAEDLFPFLISLLSFVSNAICKDVKPRRNFSWGLRLESSHWIDSSGVQ